MGVKFSQLPVATSNAADDYIAVLDTSENLLKRTTLSHASTSNVFGLGSTANYGHNQIVDDLNQTTYVNGKALSARQGNVLGTDLGTIESGDIAEHAHVEDEYFMWKGQFVKVTANIAIGDTIVTGTNVSSTNVSSVLSELNTKIDNIQPGGGKATLTVSTTIPRLYRQTVTATDGTETQSTIFDDYGEAVLKLSNVGTYTVSCDIYSTTVSVSSTGDTLVAEIGPKIVSWSSGTDREIANLIAAADIGDIDLYTNAGWRVGDERQVNLAAMSATGVGESHVAQTVTFVLMHRGLYQYNTAVASGRTLCSFVVGMKNCLAETGYMNSTNTNSGSWKNSARRSWCNSTFRNAIPSTLRSIFKQVKVTTAQTYNGSTNEQTVDYFFLPAAGEVFKGDSSYGQGGTAGAQTAYSNLTEFNAMTRWTWYATTSNRIKSLGDGGSANYWWERSPYYNNSYNFCIVSSGGNADYSTASVTYGLAVAGCI